jgi:hypothetical protein
VRVLASNAGMHRSWRPDPEALRGRLAVVAGATRGAGRGIAAALGEAGATVVCTGRSSRTRALRSDYDRPETVEETAELVTSLGGRGIPEVTSHHLLTPGWLRSEMMLDNWCVTEENWHIALNPARSDGPTAPPGFAVSESPRYVGRGIAAMAADENRSRWNQRSVTSAELAREYGFTDIDGHQPDGWAEV